MAGFGNRGTDDVSYRAVGIPNERIFIINSNSLIRCAADAAEPPTLFSLHVLAGKLDEVFPPFDAAAVEGSPPAAPPQDAEEVQASENGIAARQICSPPELALAGAAGVGGGEVEVA